MVRLKVVKVADILEVDVCFNSNMVRLKAPYLLRMSLLDCSFNSNMVRLKEVSGVSKTTIGRVSIPIWCD